MAEQEEGSSPASPPEAEARIRELEEALASERARGEELVERLKRTAADFDNYRKRARRDAEDAAQMGREELLRNLLSVVDSFDRALLSAGSDEALFDGMKLIYKQFSGLLEKSGLERIDAVGHPFDPMMHEAVMREETTTYEDGVIIQEFERGYRIRGKVLRPAKVKVAVAPIAGAAPVEESGDESGDGKDEPGEAPGAP